jgi:hypothetical protein
MAHAQKPYFVFRRKGRVHLNRLGRQFSWLLGAKVCASALVMLDTPRSEVVWEYWLPSPFLSFPFTSPPVRHRVPSGFKRTLLYFYIYYDFKLIFMDSVNTSHSLVPSKRKVTKWWTGNEVEINGLSWIMATVQEFSRRDWEESRNILDEIIGWNLNLESPPNYGVYCKIKLGPLTCNIIPSLEVNGHNPNLSLIPIWYHSDRR